MVRNANGDFTVNAYAGDFKTLLAFDLAQPNAKNLAGFTIEAAPGDGSPVYYLLNTLQFRNPSDHATDHAASPALSLNAPFQRFRWLHVPGQFHQGLQPFAGRYTYTVTPRYFDSSGSMLPLDARLSVALDIIMRPFQKNALTLGFTRGFVQSQAYVNHFGPKALIQPPHPTIDFDTQAVAGTGQHTGSFTYATEYEWLGWTARERIFAFVNSVVSDNSLTLDVFAYDLKEPDFIKDLLKLAQQHRVRIVLDNSKEHHTETNSALEDKFAAAFVNADGRGDDAPIVRGRFGRYSHDKVLIISDRSGDATRVLTGSTNFSVTGLYVNSNHVVVFDEPTIAAQYKAVFNESYNDGVSKAAFIKTALSSRRFRSTSENVPPLSITFAPHTPEITSNVLGEVVNRIHEETTRSDGSASVLFAVMELGKEGDENMVYDTLRALHADPSIFTYGISDTTDGIELYKRGDPHGILVTGKPYRAVLPPPFNQVPNIGGAASHQVHHKFVVCGFNGPDPTVFCGSSNLAEGGEENNGDNLLEIHDGDVAACFALEALGLIDHFDFLDRCAKGTNGSGNQPQADSRQAAIDAGVYLDSTDTWAQSYFDTNDLHCTDRELFARRTSVPSTAAWTHTTSPESAQ